ncbi:hypothetical protein Anas_02958 [Armadillidium nasatum]|uniref:Uncharacterized protein n=1 Tax=Armadillidium nasatum TaxID=96803 RepID=A0A5N5SVR4_9CRUS|nr:hypothetical protein Anas_02958 [Armadillidium nasatum]
MLGLMVANNFISKVLNTTKPFTQYSTNVRRLIHLQITRNISIDKSKTARILVNYPERKKIFSQCRSNVNTDATEEIDLNEPVKFSTSKAASWNSHRIYLTPIGLGENVRPSYELFFLTSSMGIFFLYFFVLREENDIDIKIDLEMYDRENSFKRKELEACIRIFKKKGKETKHLEEMLKQLEALKV